MRLEVPGVLFDLVHLDFVSVEVNQAHVLPARYFAYCGNYHAQGSTSTAVNGQLME